MNQNTEIVADIVSKFRAELIGERMVDDLRAGLIGEGFQVPGRGGSHPLIYADYVASGRALAQIESFVAREILPFYANSHTEASFCGQFTTRARESARATIGALCGASDEYAVIFAGSGATSGLNRLVHLFGLKEARKPLVLIGPYEHHSNILPWRESGAEVRTIAEDQKGGVDIQALEAELKTAEGREVIGSFSAASNVTGILSDVDAIVALCKSYGARVVLDYAGGAPYLPIDMKNGADAVVISTHKFIGGAGASGVLIVRKDAVRAVAPSQSGGGTVKFVSPWAHDYSESIVSREEAGTPNVLGDMRAALAFIVKDVMGQSYISYRLEAFRERAMKRWLDNPNLVVLGKHDAPRLPIFSFQVRDPKTGGFVHPQLITRILSDEYGIQARGGCACAGPYAHALLGIDQTHSEELRQAIMTGEEMVKPGWTRLGFSALMTDEKADFIIDAVDELACAPYPICEDYTVDPSTARFRLA